MAKKRKKASKKSNKKTDQGGGLPEGFWRQVAVVALLLTALLLFFGSIGVDAVISKLFFTWAKELTGWFAYLVAPLFLFLGVKKQRSEDHKIPRSTFLGVIFFVAVATGFLHLFTDSSTDAAKQLALENNEGGALIGSFVSSLIITFFGKIAGGIVLFALAIVAFHFVLNIPLTRFLRLFRVAKRQNKDVQQSGGLQVRTSDDDEPGGFKLNEGVPVQRQRASLKNTAKQLATDESHEALTTSSDPEWKFPGTDLLVKKQDKADAGDVEGNAQIIQETLSDFKINVEMQGANVGPRVTQYTLKPPAGVRLTKITALENNLALNLAATSIRMEAPIPGKRAVGIEVPNIKAATVRMFSILESSQWRTSKSPLGFAIGKDIAGQAVVGELDQMPHLLIAGATGSGKSIMINSFLSSLMYRNSPSDLKLILVDPKQVELTPYNDIPHLLTPVIIEPEKCISALKWAVAEMERRYTALAEVGKRNIKEYNKLKKEEGMPYIVIVIDELADLMMLAARDVEALIVRLAQKARAVGIHLVLATQRPSVDVITGLIKANVPARIAFTVTSQVDSRTIIDGAGAEKLLGKGDMLLQTPELAKPRRIQGAFIDDDEVQKLVDFIKMERAPTYDDEVVAQVVQIAKGGVVSDGGGNFDVGDDSLYHDAMRVVVESRKASASLLQRRLRVGYARAARLIETLEEQGVIGPADGARPREVLISSMEDFDDVPEDAAEDLE